LTEAAFDQLLRRLSEASVEFVLIGGLAVNAWGVVRGTKDVDIVVAPDVENLERVAAVAAAINGHVQAGESFLSGQPSIAGQLASGEQVPLRPSLVAWTSFKDLAGSLLLRSYMLAPRRPRFWASESRSAQLRT